MMARAVLRTDGGSRGNPGPAGAGFVIEVDGDIVCRGGKFITSATNNIAEYEAFIWGLENVHALGHKDVQVFADSELLVKQINGQYRVKNEGLKPLFIRALGELRRFSAFTVTHVRREMNEAADAMANEAMDARCTVGDAPVDPDAGQDTLF
jgi:ribonuclease HI